jgi:hypothetical protein
MKSEYDLPPILTADEVADFLRTCTETIHRMTRAGQLRAIPGLRVKRYRREVVLKLVGIEVI